MNPVRITALCGAALLFVSCSKSDKPNKQATQARQPVPVVVTKATQRDVPVEIQSVGNVQAYSLVTVRPQITGRIQEIHFEEGQDVKAGDLLITLDPSPWQAALNQALANVERDKAQMLNARLEFQRTSNLFASRIASEQDYQTAEATFLSAQSTVQADAAAVTNAMVNLNYTQIRAPIDGRTGALDIKAGNVVKAPDDALVTITQIRPIYVAFALPEQHLSAIRRRAAEAELEVRAFPPGETNAVSIGKLSFIDNTVNTNTGTILLKGTFPNSDLALWPGQFVQTILTLSNVVSATVVPAYAVQNGQNGDFIFVVKPDETVEARRVKTGIAYGSIRTIVEGLQPGETVVTDGQLRLTPGAKVLIKTAAQSSTNAAPANP